MTQESPEEPRPEYHFRKFMEVIGLPPDSDEHLDDTPRRVTEAFRDDFFCGLQKDPERHLETTFENVEQYKGDAGFVLVEDIQVESVCAHHWMPISGRAHIGYVPKDRVVGLSKLARVTEEFARRPQVQERLTNQIATAIQDNLEPKATFVVINAEHGCMSCRGIRDPFSQTKTSARRGPKGTELEDKFYQLLDL
jgi:GTP cyclohydrolase I